MEDKQLTNVFGKSEESLRKELASKYLPRDYEEIQKTINDHITRLLSGDNAFKNSLNASDAELLHAALRMALSFQKLSLTNTIDFKALSVKTEYKIENGEDSEMSNDIVEDTLSLLPTVICAFINPWLTVAIGGGTVLVKKIIKTRNGKRKEVLVKEKKADVSRKMTEQEINTIIDGICNICKEIDGIIAKIQRDRKEIVTQMQDKIDACTIDNMYPQILASIQYLAKENMDNETKNQYVENIIFCMQGYGYEIVSYTGSNAGFFIKKGNPNVTEETMYLPAIIKDVNGSKIIAMEGIVYVPVVDTK